MDHDNNEDFESLFSEHLRRTPWSTLQGSQERERDSDPDLSEREDPVIKIEQLSREYLVAQPLEERDEEKGEKECLSVEASLFSDRDKDEANIRRFRQNGCGCKRNCISQFSETEIYEHILDVKDMEKQDKELYIMATVESHSNKEVTKRGKKRQKGRHDYTVLGKPVCKPVFQLAFDVKRTCLQNLLTHVDVNGIVQRVHGNTGRKPSKSLQLQDIMNVVTFITNTADEIGLPQPAGPRGSDNVPPIYLPSQTTKFGIHQNYVSSCLELDPPLRHVHYTSFCNIWRHCLPHIKIATPKDDVCASCEKLRKEIIDSVTEEEKLDASEKFRNHIIKAQSERDVYNQCITKALEHADSDRSDKYEHYTFDFSQNVVIPHHSRQMGPVFFITPRKVQIFGFRIDSIPRQLNFIIDENESIGPDGTKTHGPNAVISMIHWALDHNNSGETNCCIHADNCSGQNTNQYVIGYFMWRVMTGRHRMIEYIMQVPGHTQSHVDEGFAAIKLHHRLSDTHSIDQLEQLVNMSASTNQCVRYPTWSWRDWKSFFQPCFTAMKGLRKYQYFRFSQAQPGIIMVKESCEDDEQPIDIRISPELSFHEDILPEELLPGGITPARQKYLYTSVRPLVHPVYQDVTCPPPEH